MSSSSSSISPSISSLNLPEGKSYRKKLSSSSSSSTTTQILTNSSNIDDNDDEIDENRHHGECDDATIHVIFKEPVSEHHKTKPPRPLWPSILAGATQAVLFNPIDRALYLRVHNREQHLFVWANWSHPFQGFANAAIYRTISGATYLYFQDSFKYLFQTAAPEWFDTIQQTTTIVNGSMKVTHEVDEQQTRRNLYMLQSGVGTCAGAANGMCLNWFQLIKFRLWSEGANAGFFTTAKHLYDVGGVKMFFRGAGVSVMRDVSFGVAYEVLRAPGLESARKEKERLEKFKDDHQRQLEVQKLYHPDLLMFACNCSAGAVASMISSPFNYCRNLVYGSSTYSSPLGVTSMLVFLARECAAHDNMLRHLNARLNLGWGTLRVGLGIASGQYVYALVNRMLGEK